MRRALLALLLLAACGRIPADRYGVARVQLEGVEHFDPLALESCLVTRPRPRVGLTLGLGDPVCGEPPFDEPRRKVALWSWPWTAWPLFDRVIFEQDLRRVERWYAARGYHDARVVRWSVDPPAAAEHDELDASVAEPGCERRRRAQGCRVRVLIEVEEGEPTLVGQVTLRGEEPLPDRIQARLRAALGPLNDARWDEAIYEDVKNDLAGVLAAEGYARAQVEGDVRVDRPSRTSVVHFRVRPGPPCVFGELILGGEDRLDRRRIVAAANVPTGEPFDQETVRDTQRALVELGAFASVTVEPVLPPAGDPEANVIDLRARVVPARKHRYRLGAGVAVGQFQRDFDGGQTFSQPQWDLHGTVRYESRDTFGGLRRLSIEDRPALVFADVEFPETRAPRFGNVVRIELAQPGFLEPRTTLTLGAEHDYGPDPFDVFLRHAVRPHLAVERRFFQHRLLLRAGVRSEFYRVPPGQTSASDAGIPANYDLTYFELHAALDLRDNPGRPRRGMLLSATIQQAGDDVLSSWRFTRMLGDARGYLPLFGRRLILAGRLHLAGMYIFSVDSGLDVNQREVGPRSLVIRGGGSVGNRGFLPGRLGDGSDGAVRAWLASIELRAALGEDLELAVFADAGDASRDPRLRFDHPQLSLGGGIRYYTIVGPIRLDVAWRVRGAQVFGTDERDARQPEDDTNIGIFRYSGRPGALHITIGSAF
ncbi:MAG: BamA/TamA family outer membrane protein [Myxococcota bacterium]